MDSGLAEQATLLAWRMSEPREFDFVPLKRAARYLVGKTSTRRRNHCLRGQRFRWRPSLEKKVDGIGAAGWEPYSEICIHTSEVDSAERGRSEVLRSGERRSCWTIFEIG